MLSQFPKDDRQILRLGMVAELDAVSLYEQLANSATSEDIKRVLLDIAKEEKTHVGEFEQMLLKLDLEQGTENEKAKKEIEKLTG